MNTYYLVRHAHADWSADENRPVSERGQEDAFLVADLLLDRPIDRIYSSPFRRAIQTISPLAQHLELPITTVCDLRERRLGDFTNSDFLAAVQDTWTDPEFVHPRGESNRAAQRRVRSFVNQLQTQNKHAHIVLSTHGNLMALLLNSFDR